MIFANCRVHQALVGLARHRQENTNVDFHRAMSIESFGTPADHIRLLKRKIENVQALRGIAILMVLAFHVGGYEARVFGPAAILHGLTTRGQAGVDLFFVISGFVIVAISCGKSREKESPGTFLLRRAARIYPLYWFYTAIYVPIFVYRPDLMNRPEGTGKVDLIRSALLVPGPDVPLVGQGWTLVHEIYFYVVFAIALTQPPQRRKRVLTGWALLVAILYCAGGQLTRESPFFALVTNPMTFEFLIGCAIGYAFFEFGFSRFATQAFLAFGIVLVAAVYFPAASDLNFYRVLVYMPPAALLLYGAASIEARSRILFPGPLRFIGDVSYSIYLSHMFVLSCVKKAFTSLNWQHTQIQDALFLACCSVAAISTGAASYYWIEKPLLRISYGLVTRKQDASKPAGTVSAGPSVANAEFSAAARHTGKEPGA